jgi:hypothetical protein
MKKIYLLILLMFSCSYQEFTNEDCLVDYQPQRGCFIVSGFRVDLDCSLEIVYVIEGIRNGRIYSIATDKDEWKRLTIKDGLCY